MDPAARSSLEQERSFLLRSLDDLDAEYEAGDLSADDYQQLKDSYTSQAAAIIRQLDNQDGRESAARGAGPEPGPGSEPDGALAHAAAGSGARLDAETTGADAGSRPRRSRLLPVMLAVLAFAAGAGWLLAQAAGERGTQGLTGSIERSTRDKVLECQQIGTDFSRLTESLMCFDEVLNEDPNNVEALTYRGWYVFLAANSATQSGDDEAAEELLGVSRHFLDRAIDIDPTTPDARAFRAVVRDRDGDADGACADISVLAEGDTPPMIAELVEPLATRLGC